MYVSLWTNEIQERNVVDLFSMRSVSLSPWQQRIRSKSDAPLPVTPNPKVRPIHTHTRLCTTLYLYLQFVCARVLRTCLWPLRAIVSRAHSDVLCNKDTNVLAWCCSLQGQRQKEEEEEEEKRQYIQILENNDGHFLQKEKTSGSGTAPRRGWANTSWCWLRPRYVPAHNNWLWCWNRLEINEWHRVDKHS